MANLTMTYSDLYTKVSEFLGTGSSPTGAKLTKVKDIVARAYRKFLYPIDNTTGELYTYSFVKQLLVTVTESGKFKYPLPANFSDFIQEPHFDDSDGYKQLTKIAPEQILEQRSATVSTGFPLYYAIAPFTFEKLAGTFYELWLDPKPDGIYRLKTFYRIDPLKPESDSDFLIGGVRAVEAQLECCFAVAESQEDDVIGNHTQLANDAIQTLIKADVQDTSDLLGNLARPRPNLFRWYSALPPDAGDAVYADD